MPTVKELTSRPTVFTGGHRACAGCGAAITFRLLLETPEVPIVASISTGCMEVVSTIFPFTAWKCSYIHSAFENSASTMSGVESAYRVLTRRGWFSSPRIRGERARASQTSPNRSISGSGTRSRSEKMSVHPPVGDVHGPRRRPRPPRSPASLPDATALSPSLARRS